MTGVLDGCKGRGGLPGMAAGCRRYEKISKKLQNISKKPLHYMPRYATILLDIKKLLEKEELSMNVFMWLNSSLSMLMMQFPVVCEFCGEFCELIRVRCVG